jgi:hypothetical protein
MTSCDSYVVLTILADYTLELVFLGSEQYFRLENINATVRKPCFLIECLSYKI